MDAVKSTLHQAAETLAPSANRLKGRVAIVTGGSSGIGRAISLAYAREGATVVVSDIAEASRNPKEAAATTADAIVKAGGEAEFIRADVTVPREVDALVAGVAAKYGRLDIMVNNAGAAPEAVDPQPIWAAKDEVWSKTLDINCNSVFYCLRAAARQMIKQEPHASGDRGWIVNLASVFGVTAAPQIPAYVASKHLVVGLTKEAALDLAPHRVHCNCIQPGYVNSAFTAHLWEDDETTKAVTAQHPFRGIGQPEDVAKIAVFLASDDAQFVTGTGITVDGGYTAKSA